MTPCCQQLEHGQGTFLRKRKESEPQDKGVSEKSLGPMRKGSFPLWDQVLCALEEQI